MIFHLVIDDKFIDMALREFEAVAPGMNKAIIVGNPRKLQYVKNTGVVFMDLAQLKRAVRSDTCGAVIFHTLHEWSLAVLAAVPESKTTIWLGWGFDYYDRLLAAAYPDGLLLPKTAALKKQLLQAERTLKKLPGKVKNRVGGLVKKLLGRSITFHPESLQKLDYFIPVVEPEHELASTLNPWFKAKYLCWNYGTVEEDMSDGAAMSNPGRDILVGNSASFENNHLELFELLAERFDLEGRRLIVPLSYGNPWYAEKIAAAGQRLFGSQFVPLTDFLPKDEYIDLLGSCGHVFMNHLRQQALGNICIMMLKGSRIYLNPANPLHGWLTKKGAFIDVIGKNGTQTLDRRQPLIPLALQHRGKNRQVIEGHWGRNAQRARTRCLVEAALQLGTN